MKISIALLLITFLYNITIFIIYFSKIHLNNYETKIYKSLIISNLIGIILEIFCIFLTIKKDTYPLLSIIINKSFLAYLVIYVSLFAIYNFHIAKCHKGNIKNQYIYNIPIYIITSVYLIAIPFLPISLYVDNSTVYSYGLIVDILYIINIIYITTCLIVVIKNIKHIDKLKSIPLIVFIIFAIINLIIRKINPGINIITITQSFIVFLMYFTIENPDLKIIKELNYHKMILEKDRQIALDSFNKLTIAMKEPLTNLYKLTQEKSTPEKELKNYSLTLIDKINSLIDITKLENNLIETNINCYQFDNLQEEIKYIIETKKIPITYNTSNNIPKYLYGDNIKIKQIIIYLLKFIENNFTSPKLKLNISAMNVGLLSKLNFNFFITHEDNPNKIKIITKSNHNTIKTKSLDYLIWEKLIIKENGKYNIKFIDNNNLSISFSIYNKINSQYQEDSQSKNPIINYFDLSNKRILILGLKKEINTISKLLNSYHAHFDYTMYQEEFISLLDSNKTYDLILYDDSITINHDYDLHRKGDILKLLNSIKLISGYKIPIVILTNNLYKDIDYIIKPVDELELNQILVKYLKEE